ncbi:hypothetical protein ACS0TY_034064 [Phlomoides rotata]
MLGVSGIGLNGTTYHIDALHEVWEAYLKIEIFGNYRANGNDSQLYSDVVNEVNKQAYEKNNTSTGFEQVDETSMQADFTTSEFASFNQCESSSATKDTSKGSKRKQIDGLAV